VTDVQSRAEALIADLKALGMPERGVAQPKSPHQWEQAYALAKVPEDVLDEVLDQLSERVNMTVATLRERRAVGLAFPEHNPAVAYGVYVRLLDARPEDREMIFAGYPDPVPPEEWTIDGMRVMVRLFYTHYFRLVEGKLVPC
jgi:hypothetical protein